MGFIRDLFSSPKAPPPIDYGAIGRQQQAANVEAVKLGAKLSRPDVVTPYYTQTFRETSPDQWLATQTLTPEYEKLRVGESETQQSLLDLMKDRLTQIDKGDLDVSGFQAEPTRVDYSTVSGRPEYDTSGATYQLPSYQGLDAFTTSAADQFFNRATARLNPQFDRAEENLRSRLINSGVAEGTPAYNEQMRQFREGKSDALSDLASQAIFQGQSLQGNILGNILTGRRQELGEIGMEYDIDQRRRQQEIAEGQAQVGLDREARDRQIAEAIRLRQLPMNELAALISGQTPFSQAAVSGGPSLAPVSSPSPVDLGALTQLPQGDALARYGGDLQRQSAALGIPTTLFSSWLMGR